MSIRKEMPAIGRPSGPMTWADTDDCEAPSCVMRSGIAVIVTERAVVDGPEGEYVSDWCTVHAPAASNTASTDPVRNVFVIAYESPKLPNSIVIEPVTLMSLPVTSLP
jgi:hypothetical protein